ncbi:hypothetical protein ALP44_101933 [Pseudomonas syringae pv. theae]|uniref:Uncharacterized protein n=1 Tax=Pseudomonas syringae pv. theae TaxID=103985 RepID=A0A3M5NH71_PSESX|nr:hypothetical protein ALP44_101933 [Pseudomonas syringae pv. theae]
MVSPQTACDVMSMKIKSVLLRIFLYGIYFFCLLMYVLFQGSEYDWMDPSMLASPPGLEPSPDNLSLPIHDESNDRAVFRGLVVTIAVVVQIAICFSLSRKEAIITVILFGVTLLLFR